MTLAAGQKLAFYEILAPIGAGGMGEVYRARDTRLGRDVAIKVLPGEFAEDEELLRRFEREAKTLASLNHPHVSGIHGVHQEDDVCFLALELVPGEDLAERLSRGALSVEEGLDVCRQIAEGLEAAHEAGVVHRDLKPANVRITPTGEVKVIDFGLAKPVHANAGGSSTDSVLATEAGRVLGTPTYMAPEQARGKSIDRRVDVWALGCVLFECLGGKRAFDGESLTDVLAAVLEREPDWTALPRNTPPRVRELVERCLTKDPRQRLRDAGDARLELERALQRREWSAATSAGTDTGRSTSVLRTLVILFAALISVMLLREVLTSATTPTRQLRLSFETQALDQRVYPRISPDGLAVVHEGELPAQDGRPALRALFRRDLDDFESVPLPGTENPVTFCFSPDGEHLAVLVEQTGRGDELSIVKVAVRGAAPTVQLGIWPRRHRREGGIAWLASGLLVGTADPDQLILLTTDGSGTAELQPIERALEDSGAGIDVFRALPDGRHVLGRTFYYEERGYISAIVALDTETGREQVVMRQAGNGALTADGRLLFTRGDTLLVAPFDLKRLEPDGPTTPLAAGLRTDNTWRPAWFDLARDGTLVWQPGGKQGSRCHLAVLERSGELTSLWPERKAYDGLVLASDDGSFFTASVVSDSGERIEVWGSEVANPDLRRILAAPGTDFLTTHFLSATRELIYTRVSDEGQNGIFRAPFDDPGKAEMLMPRKASGGATDCVDVTPDGRFLLVGQEVGASILYSILPLTGEGPRTPQPLFQVSVEDLWPKFSPDGRWLVYASEEVDRSEVVAQRFHPDGTLGPRLSVPTPGGVLPQDVVWSKSPAGSLQVVLVDEDRRRIHAVGLEEGPPVRFGKPRLITTIEDGYVMDNAPLTDGRFLLIVQDAEDVEVDRIEVVIGALSGG